MRRRLRKSAGLAERLRNLVDRLAVGVDVGAVGDRQEGTAVTEDGGGGGVAGPLLACLLAERQGVRRAVLAHDGVYAVDAALDAFLRVEARRVGRLERVGLEARRGE